MGVHVRLARVSCGATLPIPDCLQTVTSYQGHAGYNYIPTLASSPYSCLVPLPPWPTPSFRHRDLLAALRSLSLSLSLLSSSILTRVSFFFFFFSLPDSRSVIRDRLIEISYHEITFFPQLFSIVIFIYIYWENNLHFLFFSIVCYSTMFVRIKVESSITSTKNIPRYRF